MSGQFLYQEMAHTLKSYDDKAISFRTLLDRLEDCVDRISDDATWQDRFRHVWGRMEDAYAYASAMGWTQIPQERMANVLAALAEARQVISAKADIR